MQALVETAELLRGAGLACPIVSAGGTGTYDVSGRVPGVTEIQAGSYALMDTDYGDVGVPFVPAFFVLGTVVSRPALDRIVLDCGHKSATKDHGPPLVDGIAGARVTAFNDEHAVVAAEALGQPLEGMAALGPLVDERLGQLAVGHRLREPRHEEDDVVSALGGGAGLLDELTR